jgi:hypothetical protein
LVAVPERHLPRLARRGRDHHPVAADLLDAPGGGAQDDGLARPALVDELLVELPHPAALGREHPEQPAVGDGAAAGDGEHAGARAGGQRAGDAVPDDARTQLGELVAGVAACQHVEHVLQRLPREVGERVGTPDHGGHLVHRHRLGRHHGHDLLGEDVERVAGDAGLLDQPALHALGHHRGHEEVTAELGEDAAPGRLPHSVPGPADALEARGHRRRRLHLHHEVDRSHVDAQLQAGGGDEGGQLPGLQRVLDVEALLAGDGAVVRPHQLLARQLVEAGGQAFGQAAAVHEDERRAVGADEIEEDGVQRGPDGGAHLGVAGLLPLDGPAQLAHVLHRHHHLELEPLADAGVDDRHRAAAAEETGQLVEGALGGGQPDALRRRVARLIDQPLQPLQREGEVRPPLGGGHGVDLVHDHVLHRRQHVARLGREHEVERLGGGDEDVGRAACQVAAVGLRGVAGAGGDPDHGWGDAGALGFQGDAGERGPQVALHVVGERLQGRDVEHAAAALLVGRWRRGGQAVDGPQEGGQGLARPGGGQDQRVLAPADGGPALLLGRRGRGEGGGEPRPRQLREPLQDHPVQATALVPLLVPVAATVSSRASRSPWCPGVKVVVTRRGSDEEEQANRQQHEPSLLMPRNIRCPSQKGSV